MVLPARALTVFVCSQIPFRDLPDMLSRNRDNLASTASASTDAIQPVFSKIRKFRSELVRAHPLTPGYKTIASDIAE